MDRFKKRIDLYKNLSVDSLKSCNIQILKPKLQIARNQRSINRGQKEVAVLITRSPSCVSSERATSILCRIDHILTLNPHTSANLLLELSVKKYVKKVVLH